MQDLKNKVIYITGASKGIGEAVAKALIDQGSRVAISGRDQKTIEQAAIRIGTDRILPIVSDVSVLEQEIAAVEKIVAHFGQLDVVVANAGVGIFAPVYELTPDQWNTMLDTNLTGAFHTLKASVAHLKRTKGYYITIASLAGVNFFAQGAGYNASKFGLVGFTQAAMLDLRNYDVKVTTILPGSVSTYFNGHTPCSEDAWKIQPSDIGELVVDILKMNPRVLPSKIEVRPTKTHQ